MTNNLETSVANSLNRYFEQYISKTPAAERDFANVYDNALAALDAQAQRYDNPAEQIEFFRSVLESVAARHASSFQEQGSEVPGEVFREHPGPNAQDEFQSHPQQPVGDQEQEIKSSGAYLEILISRWPLVAGFVAICDFLSPILNTFLGGSALGVYVLVGGLASVGGSLLTRLGYTGTNTNLVNKFSRVSGSIAIVSAFFLATSSLLPSGIATGTIAQIVPGGTEFQQELLDTNRQIVANTERISEGVEKVAEGVSTLKRETSKNPRKELANLGISWTIEGLYDAIVAQDEMVLGLFVDGGVTSGMISGALVYDKDSPRSSNPAIRRIMAGYLRNEDRSFFNTMTLLKQNFSFALELQSASWRGTFPEVMTRAYIREIGERPENETDILKSRYCELVQFVLNQGGIWKEAKYDLIFTAFTNRPYEKIYQERC